MSKALKAFVTGAPRSGTTMLQLMVQKEFVPEATYMTQILQMYEAITRNKEEGRFNFYFDGIDANCRLTYRRALDLFVENAKAKIKKNDVILKCPEVSKHLFAFRELYPDTPLFIIIRDPRAVYASFKSVRKKQNRPCGIKDILRDMKPYMDGIYAFKNSVTDSHTYYFSYEEIVSGNYFALEKVSQAYSLPLYLEGGNEKSFDSSDAFFTPLYGGAVSDNRSKAYKNELSPKEIRLIEIEFGYFMKVFSYDFELVSGEAAPQKIFEPRALKEPIKKILKMAGLFNITVKIISYVRRVKA